MQRSSLSNRLWNRLIAVAAITECLLLFAFKEPVLSFLCISVIILALYQLIKGDALFGRNYWKQYREDRKYRAGVQFRNPRTGEVRRVKVGFSWILFFFSFCGIPLFLRKLNMWGILCIFLWLLTFGLTNLLPNPILMEPFGIPLLVLLLSSLGLWIWIGCKGNEMTAKNYLELGWEYLEPNSMATRWAMQRWHLTPINPASDSNVEFPKMASVPTDERLSLQPLLIAAALFIGWGSMSLGNRMLEGGSARAYNAPAPSNSAQETQQQPLILPECNSEGAKKTLVNTIEQSTAGKAANISISDVGNQNQVQYIPDTRRVCTAVLYTNVGKENVQYTFTWVNKDEGKWYLETAPDVNANVVDMFNSLPDANYYQPKNR